MKKIAYIICTGVFITGCGDTQLLSSKQAPDEMSVIEGPSLALPPDFELRPPRPGEKRTSHHKSAKDILHVGSTKNSIKADTWLIKKAGGENRDPEIRSRLENEERAAVQAKKEQNWLSKMLGDEPEVVYEEDASEGQ